MENKKINVENANLTEQELENVSGGYDINRNLIGDVHTGVYESCLYE